MQEWNLVREKKLSNRGCDQDENGHRHDSAKYLGQGTAWFSGLPRFFGNRNSKGEAQFFAESLALFNFRQALAHFLFKCDRVLWTVLRFFAKHSGKQITQRFGLVTKLRQTFEPRRSFHFTDPPTAQRR